MRVGIIGLGVIGLAQSIMFANESFVPWDPAKMKPGVEYPYDELAACDFAVVCVGTPQGEGGKADLSYVEAAIRELPPGLPVLLRSTVPPGTTDALLSGRHYCHAPEFMGEHERHPWRFSTDVPYLILGGDPNARAFFRPLLQRVFPGTIHECTAQEAELVKYTANLYWATRVTFVNEMAMVCERFGVDYEKVREGWLQDPRMTGAYTAREGFPAGFGGRCWPKDLAALIVASADAGYVPEFLEAVEDANGAFITRSLEKLGLTPGAGE